MMIEWLIIDHKDGVQNRTHRLTMHRRRLQGKQGWGGLVAIPNVSNGLYEDADVGQLGEKWGATRTDNEDYSAVIN